jgi:ectoine hydroxylase-related dioxygenase (phytanoyl-CoA dioxygenase family)
VSVFCLSDEQRQQFLDDGFFIAERLFDAEEIELLGNIARADHRLDQDAVSRRDAQGSAIRLLVENEVRHDVYGAVVRSRRIVDTMEQLLGGEVYHYHHKMILKEPFTGGAWEWHQDYGYWYNNGCLYPLLASCMIAIDRATKENGCLQVLKGSQHLGRIEHVKVGDQPGADPEHVTAARQRLQTVHCALEPGSAIFFHCNVLHCSAPNRSEHPRWAFIACYNAARNDPYKESRHPRYSPLDKWPDSAVKEYGRRQWEALATHF